MSMLIAAFMFIALLAVSTAHFLWSIGKTWPIRGEKLLAQTVVGTAGIEHMPPRLASFGVAVFILLAGIAALALADHDGNGLWLTIAGFVFALLFLARGGIGYTAWWANQTPEPNFRLNDRRVYSPMCLFVGAGFLALAIMRLL
ncbi:Protein of unknown function [Devosia sp. YR412]|uniref:DUF3995 domain-containing protein n=1 Tax=Devosia sp. YR412 TaxID=1881030 RepID=UPI0008C67EB5|nr:DUF3995 domain-containing protein [Devosia sp. YR412]SEQ03997.1 Protein of unknown function [Devosia sp. YR412]